MTRGTEDKIPKRCGLWSLLQAVCEWFELERYRLLDKNEWIWFELDKYSALDKSEWLYMGLSKKGLEGCYFLPSDVYFLVVKSCCFRRSLKKFDTTLTIDICLFFFLSFYSIKETTLTPKIILKMTKKKEIWKRCLSNESGVLPPFAQRCTQGLEVTWRGQQVQHSNTAQIGKSTAVGGASPDVW